MQCWGRSREAALSARLAKPPEIALQEGHDDGTDGNHRGYRHPDQQRAEQEHHHHGHHEDQSNDREDDGERTGLLDVGATAVAPVD